VLASPRRGVSGKSRSRTSSRLQNQPEPSTWEGACSRWGRTDETVSACRIPNREQAPSHDKSRRRGLCRRQLVGEPATRCVRQIAVANEFAPTEISPSPVRGRELARDGVGTDETVPACRIPNREQAPSYSKRQRRGLCRRQRVGEPATRCIRQIALANEFAPTAARSLVVNRKAVPFR